MARKTRADFRINDVGTFMDDLKGPMFSQCNLGIAESYHCHHIAMPFCGRRTEEMFDKIEVR